MNPIYFFLRFGFRFLPSSDLGTWTNARASLSNSTNPVSRQNFPKPFGFSFFAFFILVAPVLGDAHVSGIPDGKTYSVSQSLPNDLRQRLKESPEIRHLAVVESKLLLPDITKQMKRGNRNIRSLNGTFQQRPEILGSVDVCQPSNIALRMVNRFVNVCHAKHSIGWSLISVNSSPTPDITANFRQEIVGCLGTKDRCPDLAGVVANRSLQDSMNGGLAHGPTALNRACPFFGVHVFRLATDIGCVGLCRAIESVKGFRSHRLSNSMKHEPGCFLSHSDGSGQFVATDSVATIGDAPHGHKPFIDTERAILKYRSDFMRELLAAVLATQHVACGNLSDPVRAASRTDNLAGGPLDLTHVSIAGFEIGEVSDGRQQGLGQIFHDVYPQKGCRPDAEIKVYPIPAEPSGRRNFFSILRTSCNFLFINKRCQPAAQGIVTAGCGHAASTYFFKISRKINTQRRDSRVVGLSNDAGVLHFEILRIPMNPFVNLSQRIACHRLIFNVEARKTPAPDMSQFFDFGIRLRPQSALLGKLRIRFSLPFRRLGFGLSANLGRIQSCNVGRQCCASAFQCQASLAPDKYGWKFP